MDEESKSPALVNEAEVSSRSVANLSLEKLYRKRAIDRDNQRQLRHKNKARLVELETAVARLTQDLSRSESERKKLESSTELYSSKLESAISVLQSLKHHVEESPQDYQAGPATEPRENQNIIATSVDSLDNSLVTHDMILQLDHCDPPSTDFWYQGGSLTFPLDASTPLNLHEFSIDIENLAGTSPSGDVTSSGAHQNALDLHVQDGSPHQEGVFDNAREEANKIRDKVPIWGMVPTFCPSMCSMDALVLTLIEQRKRQVNREFAHLNFPSISSLLNPVLFESDKPVASTIARHVARVIRVHTTPEKIALLYTMCIFIRWLICPTEDNYDCIPEFLRPTGAQLTVPHPIWIGTIGWPRARENLIRYMDFSRYQEFATVINKTFSINWPYQLGGIIEGDADSGFILTEQFVQHVRHLSNWTVGQEVVQSFPFLNGCMNIKSGGLSSCLRHEAY